MRRNRGNLQLNCFLKIPFNLITLRLTLIIMYYSKWWWYAKFVIGKLDLQSKSLFKQLITVITLRSFKLTNQLKLELGKIKASHRIVCLLNDECVLVWKTCFRFGPKNKSLASIYPDPSKWGDKQSYCVCQRN